MVCTLPRFTRMVWLELNPMILTRLGKLDFNKKKCKYNKYTLPLRCANGAVFFYLFFFILLNKSKVSIQHQ